MPIDLSNLASPGAAAAAPTPAQPAQPPAQPAAAQQQAQGASDDDSKSDDETISSEPVNLQRTYSKINESLVKLLDGLGVRRSTSIPHVRGEQMHEHIEKVGVAVQNVGGVTSNILLGTHTQHDPNGGSTTAYPAQKLRETIIPHGNEAAKVAVAACKEFVSKAAKLLGKDDPAVQVARDQINMVGKYSMEAMTAFDCVAALLSIPTPLIQKLAQKHSEQKHGGAFHAALTAPRAPQQVQE